MNQTDHAYERIIGNFIEWAQGQDDIRAAIMVGSRTRSDHPADEWSDADIILFTSNAGRYQVNSDWYELFGHVWVTTAGRTVVGEPERLVLYEGGLQVDFVFHDSGDLQHIDQMIDGDQIPETLRRGVRILIDKDGRLARLPGLPMQSLPPHQPPTQEEFLVNANSFLFTVVYCAKQLCRNELFMAKSIDLQLKWLLVQMMEWHARAMRGWNYDTWHGGRFIREWSDPYAYDALAQTYAPFRMDDSWRALFATMDLYRRLAAQVAERLDYTYPHEADAAVTRYVERLYTTTAAVSRT